MEEKLLFGRELTLREADLQAGVTASDLAVVRYRPAITSINGSKRCERCGSVVRMKQSYPCICGKRCVYCKACLTIGKIRACDTLISLEEPNLFSPLKETSLKWEGQLSDQQSQASEEICQSIQADRERVVWAVTGAGKTEMLFKGIEAALNANKRVCIASPRVDVCLELAPRVRQAFPDIPLAVLYGGAEETYSYTQLVIATTHQLLRFREAFDVLVIDEIDAFPFYLNDMLYYAVDKAKKTKASTLYLTATPDTLLKKRIQKKTIDASILPARYHGQPLPVPSIVIKGSLMSIGNTIPVYFKHIQNLLTQKKKFLLFIPTIQLMEKVMKELDVHFHNYSFASVHSRDSQRKEKVAQMRNNHYDFLVTTTILERGVTFSAVDVIVIQAEHRIFTEAALIQIAGRAGRSKECPKGEVTFYSAYMTRAIKNAVRGIKAMNCLAFRKGLLK